MRYDALTEARRLPAYQRADYLLSVGYKDADIPDLLNFLAAAPSKPKARREETFQEIATRRNIFSRLEALKANAKPTAEDLRTEQERQFERDILLNRYLMGGSTRLDDASLSHPKLLQSDVVRWLTAIRPKVALIIGSPGSGKTWGTLAYMNSVTQIQQSLTKVEWSDSVFVPAFELCEIFHNKRKDPKRWLEVLNKKHLLVDDLGAEPSGFKGSDFISDFDYLFSERHKFRRCTYLTSNAKSTEEIRTVYGERFASRFSEDGSFYETVEGDLRRRMETV